MGIESKIENVHLLTDIFGRFPSFHDAEVVRITLERGERRLPDLQAAIHVFEMTSQIDAGGHYILKNHSLVSFRFSEVIGLKLEGFNHQNVLGSLTIADVSEEQSEAGKFQVSFDGIFGVSADFKCESIRVEAIEPYDLDGN